MRSACDQSTLPIDVQVFHCKARDPHVEAWRVGCHLSCPPRHSTEVPNHTVYERRVRYNVFAAFILWSMIVRVHYFVRGGFVGHRSRASSKHLSPHLPVDELDSSGVKKGLRCRCKMHVWVSGPQKKPTRC
ncbi:hypothetical protein TNCV_3356111 [Trichonephila clavipes]|nr:hypothetical protein TNCV_3356111 [Trichonephila clavipes]